MNMRAYVSMLVGISLVWVGSVRASSCLDCHPARQGLGPNHQFGCSYCHRGREDGSKEPETHTWKSSEARDRARVRAHDGLVPNPADFTRPGFICGTCHREEANRVTRSLMSSAAGVINQTRYLWGSQPDPGPRFATREIDGLAPLPESDGSGPLVDDLLRRSCLRCHLGTPGARRPGDYHAAGCAACHIQYDNRGAAADEPSPAPGARGKPVAHRITAAMPGNQCLHCHNGNRVGSDYAGLFERDHLFSFNFEAKDPSAPDLLYGQLHHRLLPDIHYERGMHCIDCHPVEEIMGDGRTHSSSQDQVRLRCTDCHGLPGKAPKTHLVTVSASSTGARSSAPAFKRAALQPGRRVIVSSGGHLLTNTSEKGGEFFLKSKIDDSIHRIPVLGSPEAGPLNHRIPGHLTRMECSACHAAWTFQDLGFHLARLDSADYSPWTRLMRQGDPQAQEVLEQNLAKPREQWSPPVSQDWLSGLSRVGVWMGGYSMRRWEERVLGINSRGHVSIMRPQYQFWISHVDDKGHALLDSVIPLTADGRRALAWSPYSPHTIRRQTPACWDCHENPAALGLGDTLTRIKDGQSVHLSRPWDDGLGIDFELNQVVNARGESLQITSQPGARFLDDEHLKRMSAGNLLYVRYLLEYYRDKEAYGNPLGFTGRN